MHISAHIWCVLGSMCFGNNRSFTISMQRPIWKNTRHSTVMEHGKLLTIWAKSNVSYVWTSSVATINNCRNQLNNNRRPARPSPPST